MKEGGRKEERRRNDGRKRKSWFLFSGLDKIMK